MPDWLTREVSRVATNQPAQRRHPYPAPAARTRSGNAAANYLATVLRRGTAHLATEQAGCPPASPAESSNER